MSQPFKEEHIVLCVDISAEMGGDELAQTAIQYMGTARPWCRLDVVKHILSIFVDAKLGMYRNHRVAVCCVVNCNNGLGMLFV